jgi:type I restriction enzyme M protein
VERDADYYNFSQPIASRSDLGALVAADIGVSAREAELTAAFDTWWEANKKVIVELPETRALMATRATLLDSFVAALTPVGVLDRFQVAGVIASWWGDIQFDLRALAAGGFGAVIDGWVTTITTGLDDRTAKGNPLDHRLVRVLLPAYLDDIEEAAARRAELDVTIKGASSKSDDAEEEAVDEEPLSPAALATLKKQLTAAKKAVKVLEQEFVAKLVASHAQLSPDEVKSLVLEIVRAALVDHVSAYVSKNRQLVTDALNTWWDKYAVPLQMVEAERESAVAQLDQSLKALGYV